MKKKGVEHDFELYSSEIYKFYERERRMPSFSDCLKIFKVASKDTVHRIIKNLVNLDKIDLDSLGKIIPHKKYFKNLKNISTKKSSKIKSESYKILKMLSPVEAGFPSTAENGEGEEMNLDEWLLGDRDATFILKVKGESMRDAGIMDGDYVVVERGKEPKIGDVVLAAIDNAWTIKYFRKDKKGAVYLEPANDDFPIIKPNSDLEIPAVVVSVIRKYA